MYLSTVTVVVVNPYPLLFETRQNFETKQSSNRLKPDFNKLLEFT